MKAEKIIKGVALGLLGLTGAGLVLTGVRVAKSIKKARAEQEIEDIYGREIIESGKEDYDIVDVK